MYEPIRQKSVHTVREPTPVASAHPPAAHRDSGDRIASTEDRPAHLREQLAAHLAALLAATNELRRATAPALETTSNQALAALHSELETAARRITDRIGDLSPAGGPLRLRHQPGAPAGGSLAELHARAHTLAGRVLVVAAAQQDTATAMLACTRMDAHDAARRELRAA